MKYHIITFGCQMNYSDSERISTYLESKGYIKSSLEEADLIVVVACSVRQSAIDRIFGLEKKFKKRNIKTILTGCVLENDRKKFKRFFDHILDIKDLSNWFNIINHKPFEKQEYFKIKPNYSSSYTASIPIMTGCNNFCSYCAVPYVRGPEISRPAEDILKEVEELVKKGIKEIWLLGQNVDSYQSIPFSSLLRKINDIPGDFWIRFTSPHPKDLSDDLILVMKECDKVTPYLNFPLQSGDNEVLRRMNRPYTIEKYLKTLKKIKKTIPGIFVSTDIIVGFPRETKKQFRNTVKVFRKAKYDMAYINQYSPRSQTASFKMKDDVSIQEKHRRDRILTNILRKTSLKNNKKQLNKIKEVLIEERKDNYLYGKTKDYRNIKIQYNEDKDLIGKIIKAKIIKAYPFKVEGKLI